MQKQFIVEIESFFGNETTIEVNGPAGTRTYAIGTLQNGMIILDDLGYISKSDAEAALRAASNSNANVESKLRQ